MQQRKHRDKPIKRGTHRLFGEKAVYYHAAQRDAYGKIEDIRDAAAEARGDPGGAQPVYDGCEDVKGELKNDGPFGVLLDLLIHRR